MQNCKPPIQKPETNSGASSYEYDTIWKAAPIGQLSSAPPPCPVCQSSPLSPLIIASLQSRVQRATEPQQLLHARARQSSLSLSGGTAAGVRRFSRSSEVSSFDPPNFFSLERLLRFLRLDLQGRGKERSRRSNGDVGSFGGFPAGSVKDWRATVRACL